MLAFKNTAIIPLEDIIYSGLSEKVVKWIKKCEKKRSIKAIVFKIDSPGGYAVPSKDIEYKIIECSKPTIAWIKSICCSAAYRIASACKYIVADETSEIGSLGAMAVRPIKARWAKKKGIDEEIISSGEYKGASILKEISEKEREQLEEWVREGAEDLLQDVKRNRRLSDEIIEELKKGKSYTGKKAKELNLVDYIGREKEVMELAKKEGNLKKVREYYFREKYPSFFKLFRPF